MPVTRTGTGVRRIGEYLQVPPSVIDWAISVQREELSFGNVKPIGEILLEREQITYENLMDALARQRVDRLRQCALFADLSDADLEWISKRSEEVTLTVGQALTKEDERGDSVYALLSGRLLLYRRHDHTEGNAVGVAVPGDFLGETDYFSHGNRRTSACAIEPALVLKTRYEFIRDRMTGLREPALGFDGNLSSLPGTESSADSGPDSSAAAGAAVNSAEKDVLAESVERRAVRILDADRANLFLRDTVAGDFCCRMTEGDESRTFRVQSGTEIVGYVAQTGEMVNLHEAYLDARFNPTTDVWTGYWTRTLLAGPILDSRGAILGVIQVVNKNKGFFTGDDEVLLRAFAHQTASAVIRRQPSLICSQKVEPGST